MTRSNIYDTKTIIKQEGWQRVHYCIYCTRKANSKEEWDHYDKYVYNYCDCPSAALETKLAKEAEALIVDTEFVEQVKYENELYTLNQRYGK